MEKVDVYILYLVSGIEVAVDYGVRISLSPRQTIIFQNTFYET